MLAAMSCSVLPCSADDDAWGLAKTSQPAAGGLGYVKFDTTGWESSGLEIANKDRIVYDNAKIGTMSVKLIPTPPKSPPDADEIRQGVRKSFRAMAQSSGGGLISADVIKIKGVPCVKTIVKMRVQDDFMYGGTLIFLFADSQIMVTVQSKVREMKSARSTAVFDKLTGTGELKFGDDEEHTPLNWYADLYDPTLQVKGSRNLSEDEKYDAEFPDDPLTLVRSTLAKIERTASISQRAAPFRINE